MTRISAWNPDLLLKMKYLHRALRSVSACMCQKCSAPYNAISNLVNFHTLLTVSTRQVIVRDFSRHVIPHWYRRSLHLCRDY
jgi:hypothetical protein